MILHFVPLLALLCWAAATDLRERKIRNWLTLTLMLTGLAQSLMPIHSCTLGGSALGLLSGFGITLILFLMGALGAGDVKLLAGVGAWLGPAGVLAVFVLEAILGLIIVLGQALWQRRLPVLLRNSALVLVNVVHLNEVGMEHVKATGKSARSVSRPLPYAVPTLAAVAILIFKSYITPGI